LAPVWKGMGKNDRGRRIPGSDARGPFGGRFMCYPLRKRGCHKPAMSPYRIHVELRWAGSRMAAKPGISRGKGIAAPL